MSLDPIKPSPIVINDYLKSPLHFIQDFFSNQDKTWTPMIDLKNTDLGYLLTTDLPGYDKKNIHIYLDGNFLTLKGEKKDVKDVYYYRERNYESFNRSICLPEKIMENDKVTAKFEDGVLSISFEINPDLKRNKNEIKII
jgi:HSP20 family protein